MGSGHCAQEAQCCAEEIQAHDDSRDSQHRADDSVLPMPASSLVRLTREDARNLSANGSSPSRHRSQAAAIPGESSDNAFVREGSSQSLRGFQVGDYVQTFGWPPHQHHLDGAEGVIELCEHSSERYRVNLEDRDSVWVQERQLSLVLPAGHASTYVPSGVSRKFWLELSRADYGEVYRLLKAAPPEYRANPDVMMHAVRKNGLVLALADRAIRADKYIVLAAVQKFGSALEHADPNLRLDREVVRDAVTQNGLAVRFVPRELQDDKEFMAELAGLNPRGLRQWERVKADDAARANGVQALNGSTNGAAVTVDGSLHRALVPVSRPHGALPGGSAVTHTRPLAALQALGSQPRSRSATR